MLYLISESHMRIITPYFAHLVFCNMYTRSHQHYVLKDAHVYKLLIAIVEGSAYTKAIIKK